MNTFLRVSTAIPAALVLFALVTISYAVEISNVNITEVTPTTATIEWETDVDTDATIHYGLDPSVGIVRDPNFEAKQHELTIENLTPGTVYFFRAVSADAGGNRGVTAGFTFTTEGTVQLDDSTQIEDPEERSVTENIIFDISQLEDPDSLSAITDAVQRRAEKISIRVKILGPPRVEPTPDGAIITWFTDRKANSMVHLVPTTGYNSNSSDPYTIHQGDPNAEVNEHVVEVIGLEPSTEYHFNVTSEDKFGLIAETFDETFVTKSLFPAIRNVTVTRVQETSAVINWDTGGVLAKGLVEYTNLRTNVTRSAGNPVFTNVHSVQLTDLEFGTRYSAVIKATNESGEEVESDPFSFVTVRDVIPPLISKVNNESTLFPGQDTKIQTIIAWETDEPATCQVIYNQGLVSGDAVEGQALPAETNPVTSHTQVVVGFAPATVYKFWMRCEDEALNVSQSEDFVLITPVKEKNIIDIILENFEGTFGWINNIGQ